MTAAIALVVLILAALGPAADAAVSPEAAWAVRGTATHYNLRGSGWYAAMPEWRWGDRAFTAHVCRTDTGRCIDVVVSDHCACGATRRYGPTVIDLSHDAFRALGAPLSVGVLPVEVQVGVDSGGVGPRPTIPPTDTG
jgi:hypothetical protein